MTPHAAHRTNSRMSRGLVLLFAVATGQAVASNYLVQPLLDTLRVELDIGTELAGLIVTTAQVGYAAGLVLLLPLGDLLERRRLISALAAITTAGLAAMAAAPSIGLFMVAAGAVGLTSVMAQLLVPFAATLAPEAERGRVIGTVMSGLLLGILLARTASGLIAGLAGWRVVYVVASLLMLAQLVVLWRKLPRYHAPVSLGYPRLLASLPGIARAEPVLRRRALFGAMSFAAFSVLWTNLAFLLSGPPYGFGEATIGLFGLIGAAGVLTATLVGRLNDRGWANTITGLATVMIVLGHVLLRAGAESLAALIAGIIVLDVGCQGVHITDQSQIYRLRAEARNRINSFYMTACFTGAAVGSAAAAFVYSRAGWTGASLLGAGIGLAAVAWWALGLWRRTGERTAGEQRGEAREPAAERPPALEASRQ
jgi:predicted MFS family arabinose efflux permease